VSDGKHRILVTGGSGFIGSHFVEWARGQEYATSNVDLLPPRDPEARANWIECDIKDAVGLQRVFEELRPTRVLHLAAKANLNGKSVADFPENVTGTANVVESVNRSNEVELLVNVSTQYVVTPGVSPRDVEGWQPYTAYGESKAEAERIVRRDCRKPWIIARPTNVWGPRHPFFPYELWRYLERRWYVHPGRQPIRKYYCYIDNAVLQLGRLIFSDLPRDMQAAIRYISDPPIDNAAWMNAFSLRLSGKAIRRLPIPLWKLLAVVGDISAKVGIRFPVSSQRLYRLTVNEDIPEEMIVDLPDSLRVDLEEGVDRSVDWFRQLGT
jgi:nucleoside-diphosphate-sugar epimerase